MPIMHSATMVVRLRKSNKLIGTCDVSSRSLVGRVYTRAYCRKNGTIGMLRYRYCNFTTVCYSEHGPFIPALTVYNYRNAELLPGFVAFDEKEQAKWKHQWDLCQ